MRRSTFMGRNIRLCGRWSQGSSGAGALWTRWSLISRSCVGRARIKVAAVGVLLLTASLFAQGGAHPVGDIDRWKALGFLEGTWEAKTHGGSAGAESAGTYTFQWELGRHVLAR